jgi:hypothetical protein
VGSELRDAFLSPEGAVDEISEPVPVPGGGPFSDGKQEEVDKLVDGEPVQNIPDVSDYEGNGSEDGNVPSVGKREGKEPAWMGQACGSENYDTRQHVAEDAAQVVGNLVCDCLVWFGHGNLELGIWGHGDSGALLGDRRGCEVIRVVMSVVREFVEALGPTSAGYFWQEISVASPIYHLDVPEVGL